MKTWLFGSIFGVAGAQMRESEAMDRHLAFRLKVIESFKQRRDLVRSALCKDETVAGWRRIVGRQGWKLGGCQSD